MSKAIEDVIVERSRQDARWGTQNHGDLYWLGIHTEELGEVAKAIIEAPYGGDVDDIRKELVQLCATTLAHIECIDRLGQERPIGNA